MGTVIAIAAALAAAALLVGNKSQQPQKVKVPVRTTVRRKRSN